MADQQPATKADFDQMNVAITAALADLTAAVNKCFPNLDNNYRRRRDRHEEPIKVSRGHNYNNIDSVSLLGKRSSVFKRPRQKDKVLPVKVSHDDFYNRVMGPMLLLNKRLSIQENTPEKVVIFPEKVEDKVHPVVVQSHEEIQTDPKESTTDFGFMIKETKDELVEDISDLVKEASEGELVEDILEPTKPLSQEIMKEEPKDNASIVTTTTILDQTETVPDTVFVSNRFKFNKTSLVWERPRQYSLELETVSNFKRRIMDLDKLKTRRVVDLVVHQSHKESREIVFQVNSRASSFQVRVTDTERFRGLMRFLFDLWRKRKRVQRKPENWQFNKENKNERMCKVARPAPKPPWRVPCGSTRIPSRLGDCLLFP